MVFGLFLFFRGPFIWSFASLDLVRWVSEIMTDAVAVGVVTVGISVDKKFNVLDFLGSTGEVLVKGCSFPAERLLAPCTTSEPLC